MNDKRGPAAEGPDGGEDLQHRFTKLASSIGATEAVVFACEFPDKPDLLRPIAHIRPDGASQAVRDAAIHAFIEILQPCLAQRRDGAIEIVEVGNESETQYCLVTLIRSTYAKLIGAACFIVRCKDQREARAMLSLVQAGT